jgi:lipopolysaccharide biosynthesis regulator YciM
MDQPQEGRKQLQEITEKKTVRAKQIPIVVEARFALGKLEYQEGNYRAAVDVYRQIAEMNSIGSQSRFMAYKHLGRTYRTMGATEQARQMFQEAYQIQPTDSSIRNSLRELGVKVDDRYERFESSQP